jgi:hypothetical protein
LCIPPLEFCKVLNINPGDKVRAYSKGDIFIVRSFAKDDIVIWYELIGSTMAVKSENFINIKYLRNIKIDEILNDTNRE